MKNLKGKDLSYSDLSGLDLRGVDLRDCNLDGANLRGVRIDSTTKLEGASLRYAHLINAQIDGGVLEGVDLSYTVIVEKEESEEVKNLKKSVLGLKNIEKKECVKPKELEKVYIGEQGVIKEGSLSLKVDVRELKTKLNILKSVYISPRESEIPLNTNTRTIGLKVREGEVNVVSCDTITKIDLKLENVVIERADEEEVILGVDDLESILKGIGKEVSYVKIESQSGKVEITNARGMLLSKLEKRQALYKKGVVVEESSSNAKLEIEGVKLLNILKLLNISRAKDNDRLQDAISGVYIKTEGEFLKIITCDGYTLLIEDLKKEEVNCTGEVDIILNGRAMLVLLEILKKVKKEKIVLEVAKEGIIVYLGGGIKLNSSALLGREYIKYKGIIKGYTEEEGYIELDTEELKSNINIVQSSIKGIKGGRTVIKLSILGDKLLIDGLELKTPNTSVGYSQEDIKCLSSVSQRILCKDKEDVEGVIYINGMFLEEYLKYEGRATIRLQYRGKYNPLAVRRGGTEGMYLFLPIRVVLR